MTSKRRSERARGAEWNRRSLDTARQLIKGLKDVVNFCPECGAPAQAMTFCAECGTPLDPASGAHQPVATVLSHEQQVAILEREIAELAKDGWGIHGRAHSDETVSLPPVGTG